MIRIGLIKEGKIPSDNRVALTPEQCKRIQLQYEDVEILVQSSENRCYSDAEYIKAGFTPQQDITKADILLGIKEVPVSQLIPEKTYLFFSHTVKKQPYNRELFQAIIKNKITLIDYELLKYSDGVRILGFGFFAGVVGAHNGLYGYGKRTGAFEMQRAFEFKSMQDLFNSYKSLNLPPVKIVVTGSGRVSKGIVRVMQGLEIKEVSPADFLENVYHHAVYTQLKGKDLYIHKSTGSFNREDFHQHPENYSCTFAAYTSKADILMNGIFWNESIARLFESNDMAGDNFKISTIADITDDKYGSVPCNLGDSTIEDPIYGVDRISMQATEPYISSSIDVMSVGNLPNELPRDASDSFGEEFIENILPRLMKSTHDEVIENATMVKNGVITPAYSYLEDYGRMDNA